MIVADTSVWIDHLNSSDRTLERLLERGSILMHPFVIGEIALGSLRQRKQALATLQDLPQSQVANDHEVLTFIEAYSLGGRGIGYVDAHLLAAVLLTPHSQFWTRDKRLRAVAMDLNIAATLE